MFDHTHYLPILKYKSAEMGSLIGLEAPERDRITPLIALCPDLIDEMAKKQLSVRRLFQNITLKIGRSWGVSPFFVDFELIESQINRSTSPLIEFADIARSISLRHVPVTSLSRYGGHSTALKTILAKDKRGVCLRLTESEVSKPTLPMLIDGFLSTLRITPSGVHLLVDQKVTSESTLSIKEICEKVPKLNRWKTFTVASGAFPVDLSKLKKNDVYRLPRFDWMKWSRGVTELGAGVRLPTYGDYSIQHPAFKPPPAGFKVSASIRYGSTEEWIIVRGEALTSDNWEGNRQYLAEAKYLSSIPEFCGRDFSYGDAYIYDMGNQSKRTGNPFTWLRAGLSHQLVFAVRQVANFVDTSIGDARRREFEPAAQPSQRVRTPANVVYARNRRPGQPPPRG